MGKTLTRADLEYIAGKIASGGAVKVDNKTTELNSKGEIIVKNEGITRSKLNSEAGIVFEDDKQELTNKTIDATKNTIKNLPAAGITAIDTSALTTTDDTHVPSSKLVKNYADTKVSIPSDRKNKILGWNESGNMKLFSYQKVYEHFCAIKRNASTDATAYITFSVRNYDSSLTYAKLCSWLYSNGFTSKEAAYPAAGLAASNTIYVASSSGGANTTSFSATSCINGIFSSNGTALSYIYRAGTTVSLEAGRFNLIKTISRGYELTD